MIYLYTNYLYIFYSEKIIFLYILNGDWGLGIGDWGFGVWGLGR
jgi:hypothetical protein